MDKRVCDFCFVVDVSFVDVSSAGHRVGSLSHSRVSPAIDVGRIQLQTEAYFLHSDPETDVNSSCVLYEGHIFVHCLNSQKSLEN